MRFTVLIFLLLGLIQPAHAIKKCQDEDGNWHYGDIAVDACRNSKIVTLTDQGFIKEQLAAPKTKEQLNEEEKQALLVQQEIERKRKLADERRRIQSIYESEEDIGRQRHNQMHSVRSSVKVHEAYLVSMKKRIAHYERKKADVSSKVIRDQYDYRIEQAKARMDVSRQELQKLEQQKDSVIAKFDRELAIYRSIKAEKLGEPTNAEIVQLLPENVAQEGSVATEGEIAGDVAQENATVQEVVLEGEEPDGSAEESVVVDDNVEEVVN